MSDAIKAATINARCATALIRAMGMQAENEQRKVRGESMAFVQDAFENVIIEEGVHWNAIAEVLRSY
jgi:hypothetical protein